MSVESGTKWNVCIANISFGRVGLANFWPCVSTCRSYRIDRSAGLSPDVTDCIRPPPFLLSDILSNPRGVPSVQVVCADIASRNPPLSQGHPASRNIWALQLVYEGGIGRLPTMLVSFEGGGG